LDLEDERVPSDDMVSRGPPMVAGKI